MASLRPSRVFPGLSGAPSRPWSSSGHDSAARSLPGRRRGVASAAAAVAGCQDARERLRPSRDERGGRLGDHCRQRRGAEVGPASSVSFAGVDGAGDGDAGVDVSVIIPAYNEENNIGRQIRAVSEVLDGECQGGDGPGGRSSPSSLRVSSYEIICVNDCSSDGTSRELAEVEAEVPRLRVLEHRANAGQTAALRTGLRSSRGRVIVTMDGDYQNDPADIPLLLGKLRQRNAHAAQRSNDLVCGYREARREKAVRVVLSRIMNKLITRCTGVHIVDTGCGLKAMEQWLAKDLARTLKSEMHRYIPYLASNAGATIAQVPVKDLRREHGESKYTTLGRLPRVLVDCMLGKFSSQRFFPSARGLTHPVPSQANCRFRPLTRIGSPPLPLASVNDPVCCSRKDNAFFFFGVAGLVCLALSTLCFAACLVTLPAPPLLRLSFVSACTMLLLGFQAATASVLLYLLQDTGKQSPGLVQ